MIGINDPRTDPWYSAETTALLQAVTTSGKPVLLRVDYGGGHVGSSGDTEMWESVADMVSFDLWQLGARGFQPVETVVAADFAFSTI